MTKAVILVSYWCLVVLPMIFVSAMREMVCRSRWGSVMIDGLNELAFSASPQLQSLHFLVPGLIQQRCVM
jgi:hypothetical protein